VGSGKSLAEEMDMIEGDGQSPVVDMAMLEQTPQLGLEFLAECERLRRKVEHALSSSGKSLVNGINTPTASESTPVAIQGLRTAVNAMLCEMGTLREHAKFSSMSLTREVTGDSTPSIYEDSSQANPESQESTQLQRECRQLHKEVESAIEWVRRARRLTEAKRGMLNVHGALATRTNASTSNGAPQLSAAEVKLLQHAVVRAAEAEREAHDLLAAKQELLAVHEARLRESDKIRLDQVVSAVGLEGSLNSPGYHTNGGAAAVGQHFNFNSNAGVKTPDGTAVWHVMLDDTP